MVILIYQSNKTFYFAKWMEKVKKEKEGCEFGKERIISFDKKGRIDKKKIVKVYKISNFLFSSY